MLDRLNRLWQHCRTTLLGLPLPAKFALLLVSVLGLHSLLLLAAGARGSEQLMLQQQALLAQQWVRQIALQAQPGLMQSDKLALHSTLRLQLQNPLLHYAGIYDSEDKILVEAGTARAGLRRFDSDILIGKDIAGRVVIGLDSDPVHNELRALNVQLFILAAVLTGLIGALFFSAGNRLDRHLQRARRELLQPSETPGQPGYTGRDSLGILLESIYQHEPALPELQDRALEQIVLQLHWSHYQRRSQQWGKAELTQRLERSYRAALLLARLYQGRLAIYRGDGISLCFSAVDDADQPLLRALCCAHLLQTLDGDLGASPRIGMMRETGNRFQLSASEATLVDTLAQMPFSEHIQTRLSGDINALLAEWADSHDNGVELKTRYRALLQKQLAHLSRQIESDDPRQLTH